MNATRVSLLLPNYNNERLLGVVLDRLAENTTYPDIEVVIVDDGSTDGSRDILRRWRDSAAFIGDVRLLETPNRGAIAALHTGGVNVVGPGGVHDRPSRLLEPIGQRRWHHRVERPLEGTGGDAEHRVAEVDAACGCCMMYRRDDALTAGGYDTGYAPVWFDDIDLSLSIRRLGRKNFYLPDVRVVHYLQARQAPVSGQDRQRGGRRLGELSRRVVRRLPTGAKARIEERFEVDLNGHFTRAQLRRLLHHYRYWGEKWGFDLRNPDMVELERRWGATEVCWAMDLERRAAGAEIVRNLERTRAST
jgi:glycosyltransferase involved in cell wall biosynthesis